MLRGQIRPTTEHQCDPESDPVEGDGIDGELTADLDCAADARRSLAEEVFGGSRFMFWALGPLCVFLGISMFLTIDASWSLAAVMRVVLGTCCLLFALALWSPRLAWCARGVTAIVFALCALYIVDAWLHDSPSAKTSGPGDSSLANAIRAMLVFGLPSLWFTVRRRRPTAPASDPGPDF